MLKKEAIRIACEIGSPILDFCLEIPDKSPYVYEMKKDDEGKCVFLKDKRCGIYGLRPLVCMFYPYELKFNPKTKQYSFDFTTECPAIGIGKSIGEKDFRKLFEAAQERHSEDS